MTTGPEMTTGPDVNRERYRRVDNAERARLQAHREARWVIDRFFRLLDAPPGSPNARLLAEGERYVVLRDRPYFDFALMVEGEWRRVKHEIDEKVAWLIRAAEKVDHPEEDG